MLAHLEPVLKLPSHLWTLVLPSNEDASRKFLYPMSRVLGPYQSISPMGTIYLPITRKLNSQQCKKTRARPSDHTWNDRPPKNVGKLSTTFSASWLTFRSISLHVSSAIWWETSVSIWCPALTNLDLEIGFWYHTAISYLWSDEAGLEKSWFKKKKSDFFDLNRIFFYLNQIS